MGDLRYELLSETLNQFNTGVILLHKNGQIIHTNSIAKDILAQKSVISMSKGLLRCKNKTATLAMRDALLSLGNQDNGPDAIEVCLERASDVTDAVVGSFRLLRNQCFEQPVIALFVTKREQPVPYSLLGVAQSYDLTRAETRTLEQIACGRVIADAAQGRVVSKNTVKTHLQKIFEKTGTSRQTDLLRLVYAFRAPLRGSGRVYRM